MLGLVKETHAASVRGRLTLEASFRFFRDSVLNHSVQRPPFSIGVFAQHETRAVLQWFISSYYRHYKLYQYAFTDRVTLDVSTRHPWELVEAPPCPPPLAEAITNEQHEEELERQRQEREAEEAAAAVAAAAEAEAACARAVQEEYEAALPEDVKGGVQRVMERELAHLRREMELEFERRHTGLLAKLAALEERKGARASGAGA